MTASRLMEVSLAFGASGQFACEVEGERVLASRGNVPPVESLEDEVALALASPLEFPPLGQAVIPDDRVVLALAPGTPGAPVMIAGAWEALAGRGVAAENVLILQASGTAPDAPDPRSALPPAAARRMQWKVHNPDRERSVSYLASTASGERIYLATDLVDAEVVVSIGQIAYDPLIGCRGTSSAIYPGLSTRDAIRRAQGQGHDELGPEDDRPLRQLIDEVAWLLGMQFGIQSLPSAGGGASRVLAGAMDAVFRRGRRLLEEQWLVELDSRPEIVVAAVDADAAGHGWDQVGAALAAARGLVARGGKIVLLTELAAEPGEGIDSFRGLESPRDALRPLRSQTPPDLLAATQLASAADWARVYLHSALEPGLVEELFMAPVESLEGVERLLATGESCAFLASAQHIFGRVRRT